MAWLRSVTNHVEVSCTWRPDFFLQATPLMAADSIRVGFVSQDAVITWDVQGLEKMCSGRRLASIEGDLGDDLEATLTQP